jgi:type I restriction enzyme S subunit
MGMRTVARRSVQSRGDDTVAVPPGYKRTDVGVIPEGWTCSSVGDVAKIKGGKRLPPGFLLTDTPTPHPYIRVSDMFPGGVTLHGVLYVPEEAFRAIKDYRIFSEDVFISVAGTLGIVGVVPRELDGASLTENADRITELACDRDYLLYWLMSQPIQHTIESIRTVGAQPKLALGRIATFLMALPSGLDEQRAIARALSDVDGLIGALEKLTAKKRAIKQAAMQQLLTGRTRLPGFSGKWETKRLADFAPIRNLKVLPSNVDPDTPCVELEHIGQGDGRLLACSTARYSSSSKYRFFSGDVLFGRLRSYLRKFWHADRDGICTTEIWPLVVDPEQASSGFLHAIVQTNRFIEAASISYGTHMPRADWGVMRNFEVCLPRVDEQQAIASVLSDMDAEIAALERRRDKAKAIKQGMMQQLLTGRVRLVRRESQA